MDTLEFELLPSPQNDFKQLNQLARGVVLAWNDTIDSYQGTRVRPTVIKVFGHMASNPYLSNAPRDVITQMTNAFVMAYKGKPVEHWKKRAMIKGNALQYVPFTGGGVFLRDAFHFNGCTFLLKSKAPPINGTIAYGFFWRRGPGAWNVQLKVVVKEKAGTKESGPCQLSLAFTAA